MQQILRDREPNIPPNESLEVAKKIKVPVAVAADAPCLRRRLTHPPARTRPATALRIVRRPQEQYSYVCPDLAKEFTKYDTEPAKLIKKYEGVESITKRVRARTSARRFRTYRRMLTSHHAHARVACAPRRLALLRGPGCL